MRRRSDRDYFGPMTGFKGFLHRLAMILLYPFRKPLIFIPVVILMYLIPTFIGSKPSEVHLWYWNKIKNGYNFVAETVSDKVKPLVGKTEGLMPELGGKMLPERGIDQLVGTKQKAIRRQMFEKAKSAPVAVDILENQEVVSVEEVKKEQALAQIEKAEIDGTDSVEKNAAENVVQTEKQKIVVSETLPLVYVKNPIEVSGSAVVQNANEMIVNGTYIFLYGIYVDPNLPKGIEAKKFLEQMVRDKTVRCNIVAYTYQEVATALCEVDGESINQKMVDEELSKNVAL